MKRREYDRGSRTFDQRTFDQEVRRVGSWGLLALGLALIGCGGPAPVATEPAPVARELRWTERTVERSDGDCDTSGGFCATVLYRFPSIEEAPNETLRRELEGTIDSFLLGGDGGEPASDTVEAAADTFIEDFRSFVADGPEQPGSWSDERIVEITHLDPRWVSLRFSHYQYLGGAHPNIAVVLRTLRLSDGSVPSLDELVAPGARSRLDALAETRFRELRGLDSDVGLEAAGDTSDEEARFSLNDNFAVADDGLLFYFDRYEMAPYALGPTELLLPWSELAGIVRDGVAQSPDARVS